MWLLSGSSAPPHNTINRFISKKLINYIENLFYQLVIKLSEMVEIDFSNLFVDGTKIETNANKYIFKWKKSIQKYDKKFNIKIEELLNDFNFTIESFFYLQTFSHRFIATLKYLLRNIEPEYVEDLKEILNLIIKK
ncbi:MAG: hypothetical protein LBV03_04020 [Fusobacteriales bacterium]|jgi:hypothetical protein|nr:hypothetical protein [Fusobacteriales bacterium]